MFMDTQTLLATIRNLAISFGTCALMQVSAGQEPAVEPPGKPAAGAVRLVYELPIDALQRTLQHDPKRSMEEMMAGAVATITARLGSDAKVARDGAAGFTVDPTSATPEALAAIRRRVEMLGKLELRLLANAGYEPVDLHLPKERQRLTDWLAKGGLEKLRQDPASLAEFTPEHPEHIRWVVRRVDPSNKARNYLISNLDGGRAATVSTFTPAEWRKPPTNFGHMLEVVAINLHAVSFSASDMDVKRTRLSKGRAMTVVSYYLKDDRKQAYDDWNSANAPHPYAAVLDDEIVAAPPHRRQPGGRGMLAGKFDEQLSNDLSLALQAAALPAMPKLIRQEPVAQRPRQPAEAGK